MRGYTFFILCLSLFCGTVQSSVGSTVASNLLRDVKSTMNKIEQQYIEWRGTPYRWGGTTRKGIDCSAFTLLTAKRQFNISLPRTVAEQAKRGVKVMKSQSKPGDLVFFKTGKNRLHVGIYYKDDYFLHASSSKGVVLSSLNQSYWKQRYWQTRRL